MGAAPPGTITITCPAPDGHYSLTVHYNPDTGAFNTDAITTAGSTSMAWLGIVLSDTYAVNLPIPGGQTVGADILNGEGITTWQKIQSLRLSIAAA